MNYVGKGVHRLVYWFSQQGTPLRLRQPPCCLEPGRHLKAPREVDGPAPALKKKNNNKQISGPTCPRACGRRSDGSARDTSEDRIAAAVSMATATT